MAELAQVWKLGLLCEKNGKYMSKEAFGNVNASSTTFRAKQMFTIRQLESGKVNIIAPNGKFLAAGPKGALSADSDDNSSEDTNFEIIVQTDGRWAFRTAHNYYVSAEKEEEMSAFARAIGPAEKFMFHLALHPQVNIYSGARQSFAHVEANELRANEKVPWGFDAMVSLTFDKEKAKYTLRAANNKYWTCDSKFVDAPNDNSYFVCVLAEGDKIGFRGNNGKYITAPTSQDQIMKCTSNECKTNEAFVLQDSHGQVTLLANNDKYVSMSRNQDPQVVTKEYTDSEIFQMEFIDTNKWHFTTKERRFWSVSADNSALTTVDTADDSCVFGLEHDGKTISLTQGGKYLTYRPQGNMLMVGAMEDNAKFGIDLINRPQMILRSDFGYVTGKRERDQLACNAAEPDTFYMTAKGGAYTFKAANGNYWVCKDDGAIQATGKQGDEFHLEWVAHTKFAIRAARTGQYIKGGQQGQFLANSGSGGAGVNETMWEY